ncbi:MAG: hypothetical protein WC441_01415 [Patescibacteria group bacterium]
MEKNSNEKGTIYFTTTVLYSIISFVACLAPLIGPGSYGFLAAKTYIKMSSRPKGPINILWPFLASFLIGATLVSALFILSISLTMAYRTLLINFCSGLLSFAITYWISKIRKKKLTIVEAEKQEMAKI